MSAYACHSLLNGFLFTSEKVSKNDVIRLIQIQVHRVLGVSSWSSQHVCVQVRQDLRHLLPTYLSSIVRWACLQRCGLVAYLGQRYKQRWSRGRNHHQAQTWTAAQTFWRGLLRLLAGRHHSQTGTNFLRGFMLTGISFFCLKYLLQDVTIRT